MGAWGAEIPLQDLMGYTRTDFTVATGAPEPPPPPRSEERSKRSAPPVHEDGLHWAARHGRRSRMLQASAVAVEVKEISSVVVDEKISLQSQSQHVNVKA
jgi:hypothetical protein